MNDMNVSRENKERGIQSGGIGKSFGRNIDTLSDLDGDSEDDVQHDDSDHRSSDADNDDEVQKGAVPRGKQAGAVPEGQ